MTVSTRFQHALLLAAALIAPQAAQASRVIIDTSRAPTVLFPSVTTPLACTSAGCQGTLPFYLQTASGPTNSIFVGQGGVIGLGQALPSFSTLNDLVAANVQFLAPHYQNTIQANFTSIGVVTQADINNFADFRNAQPRCSPDAGSLNLRCATTRDQFISVNNLNRFLGSVVISDGVNGSVSYPFFQRTSDPDVLFANLITPEGSLPYTFGYNVNGTSLVGSSPGYTTSDPPGAAVGLNVRIAAVGPGVPEPATWAMLIFGFGLIGALLRSVRYRAAPARQIPSR